MKLYKLLEIFTCLIIFSTSLNAQQPNLPCGTAPGKSDFLKDYQADPARFKPLLEGRGGSTMYLPLTIHIVGTDDSMGMAGMDAVLYSFCQLNQDFSATGIQFFIEPPIRYIYETAFFTHDSVKAGGIRMLQYNDPSTINIYFVGNPAGNCGYNLPYAGVAMGNGCINGHTFAHEMGHCLQLPHTFIGWEGGTGWGGNSVQSFNGPAPETVTINYTDFKDTIFLNDTLIIDTLYVERVARTGATTNCTYAADGFCDTPADYLAFRWLCTAQNSIGAVLQYDPDTVSFQSDGWYIMSYAFDACQVGFSQEQTDAMKSFVLTERTQWLYNQSPNVDSVGILNPIQPLAGLPIPSENVRFEWNRVEGATHYYLEVYKEPYAINQIVERVLLTDTFFLSSKSFTPRPASFPYAWRVMPFNYGNTCRGYNNPVYFNTVINTSIELIHQELPDWNILPNLIVAGQSFRLLIDDVLTQKTALNVYNSTGQRIWTTMLSADNGTDMQFMVPDNWVSGLYFAELKTESGKNSVKKFVIK